MKKCTRCDGQKYINGMGNMREKCKPCDGKGFVPEIEPIKITAEHIKKSKTNKDKEDVRQA